MDMSTILNALEYAFQEDNLEARLTDTSRICCIWNYSGIFVDLDLRCEDGVAVESEALYAVPEAEHPTEEDWSEAVEIAQKFSTEFNIELRVEVYHG